MARFTVTAEHTCGMSISHTNCPRGRAVTDPTDSFQLDVEAGTAKEAREKARVALRDMVEEFGEGCGCPQGSSIGSDAWWNSVTFSPWPQDEAAAAMMERDEWEADPYGLVPPEVSGKASTTIASDARWNKRTRYKENLLRRQAAGESLTPAQIKRLAK